jgi:hypothetical protein
MNAGTVRVPDTWQLLRRALVVDSAACGASGIVLLLGAGPLADLFGLPAALLRTVGLLLLPVAVVLLHSAMREPVRRQLVRGIVGLNLLWVVASLLLLASGWVEPTGEGYLFVVAQALLVLAIADTQIVGLRRAQ